MYFNEEAIKTLSFQGFSLKGKSSYMSMPPSVFQRQQKNVFKAKEIVFIGELSDVGRVNMFCDAIDEILKSGSASSFKITFTGALMSINGLDFNEYIQLRSSNWASNKIKWEIMAENSVKNTFDYMNSKNAARLAVIDHNSDFSSVMKSNFDFYGVPYVESDFVENIKFALNVGGKLFYI